MTGPLPLPTAASMWDQALCAFLVEKGNRSGSKRTVESYGRMLWRFFADRTPDQVRPAEVLAYAHGIGLSGKPPSQVTIAARFARPPTRSASSRPAPAGVAPDEHVSRPTGPSDGDDGDEPRKRLIPTCECWCGCGQETELGKFFRSGHDKVAEVAVIRLRYGSVPAFLVEHGYGPEAGSRAGTSSGREKRKR